MDYQVLATDFDGTLARHALVEPGTVSALQRLRDSGRHALLVTGREIRELKEVFPRLDLFDTIVAENGALLYNPAADAFQLLCPPASRPFADALRQRNVTPLFIGHAIIASQEPYESVMAEVIRDLRLPLRLIPNKGSIMALPDGINKASGLRAALRLHNWPSAQTIAIGDGENDHDLLAAAGFAAAVNNAVPALKERADYVTTASHGAGVVELINLWLSGKLIPNRTAPLPFSAAPVR